MGDVLILRRGGGAGGGVANAYAVIGVTYPAGATCTCTKGTFRFTAPDTSGACIFELPEGGAWTVTATDGTNTKSVNVTFTARYQVASVILDFGATLFDGGAGGGNWDGLIDGWGTATIGDTLYVSGNSGLGMTDGSGALFTVSPIDFSQYDTLKIRYKANDGNPSNSHYNVQFGAQGNYYGNTKWRPAERTAWGEAEYSLSGINDSRYITIFASGSKIEDPGTGIVTTYSASFEVAYLALLRAE